MFLQGVCTVLERDKFQFVNEAVHLEQEWIFVAIPKTGTTSIRNQTRQHGRSLIPNPHLNILQIKDAIVVFYLQKNLASNFEYPSRQVKTYLEVKEDARMFFDKAFKFSSVRNPWERAVSLYYRKEGIKVRDSISFDKFIEQHVYASDTCVQPTLHHNQIDWLCDEKGNLLIDFVFKLEEFEDAIKVISERTSGKLNLQYRIANKNEESKSERYRAMYNNETRMIIQKRFEKDIDYFKFCF